jgi:CBS domain-containing protein
MSRQDAHFDAMLRHLGAAYYHTLHGSGSAADVATAVEAVAEFGAGSGRGLADTGPGAEPVRRQGRWRVRDVMTTPVVTAQTRTSCKQVARLITEHKLSALPVLDAHGHLAGMVSEADLLHKQASGTLRRGSGLPAGRRRRAKGRARTVAELMTTPVVTTYPDAPLAAAARLMSSRHLRRLPVVDADGQLIGIVSRRDLLSVFLRPDGDIAAEVRQTLAAILPGDAERLDVSARDGVVTLSGEVSDARLSTVATRLAADVDGVVAVTSKLAIQETAQAGPG